MRKIIILFILLYSDPAISQEQINPFDFPESESDSIYISPNLNQQPDFKGGQSLFYQYIAMNLKYPRAARMRKIDGKIYVRFVIEKDGTITNVGTEKGVHKVLNEEAMRLIKISPPWNPGLKDNKRVRVKLILPITFKIMGIF